MRGMDEAAGGVDSARRSSNTKNATNIFMPIKRYIKSYIPIMGIEEDAGGVDFASSSSNMKKATNIFMPKKRDT